MRSIVRQIRLRAIAALICWLLILAGCTSPAGVRPSPSDGPVSPAPSIDGPYGY